MLRWSDFAPTAKPDEATTAPVWPAAPHPQSLRRTLTRAYRSLSAAGAEALAMLAPDLRAVAGAFWAWVIIAPARLGVRYLRRVAAWAQAAGIVSGAAWAIRTPLRFTIDLVQSLAVFIRALGTAGGSFSVWLAGLAPARRIGRLLQAGQAELQELWRDAFAIETPRRPAPLTQRPHVRPQGLRPLGLSMLQRKLGQAWAIAQMEGRDIGLRFETAIEKTLARRTAWWAANAAALQRLSRERVFNGLLTANIILIGAGLAVLIASTAPAARPHYAGHLAQRASAHSPRPARPLADALRLPATAQPQPTATPEPVLTATPIPVVFTSWVSSLPEQGGWNGAGECRGQVVAPVGTGNFIWPTDKHYLVGYDYNGRWHPGLDLAADVGDRISAVDAGVVVYAGWNIYGFGNLVIVDHGTGWHTLYAHLSQIDVACGQAVLQGTTVGLAGSTGHSTGPHLHFEMRNGGLNVNPWDYLP